MNNSCEDERLLIGCLLHAAAYGDVSKALYVCDKEGIDAESFRERLPRGVYMATVKIQEEAAPCTLPELLKVLEGDMSTEASKLLDETPTAAHIEYYAQQVSKAFRKRNLIAGVDKLSSQAKDGALDIAELSEGLASLMASDECKAPVSIKHIGELKDANIQRWEAAKTHGFVGVPSSLDEVNEVLGGYRPGTMSIIGGYRGEGKSTLTRQEAMGIAKRQVPTGLLTLEDPEMIAAANMVASWAQVSAFALDTGDAKDGTIEQVESAWEQVEKLPIYLCSSAMTIEQITSAARAMVRRFAVAIIFLDHIQYILRSQKFSSRTEEVTYYSRRVSALARELDIPIVVVSQLSRDAEKNNRAPRLSDLRDSGALEQDARQVMLLSYDEDQGGHRLEIAKNNYGPSGKSIILDRMDGQQRFRVRPRYGAMA